MSRPSNTLHASSIYSWRESYGNTSIYQTAVKLGAGHYDSASQEPAAKVEVLELPFRRNSTGFEQTASSPLSSIQAIKYDSGTKFNRELGTRNVSIFSLVVGWCISVTSLTIGTYLIVHPKSLAPDFLADRMANFGNIDYTFPKPPPKFGTEIPYLPSHRVFPLSKAGMTLIALLLNFALTLIFSSISHIHTVSLRWALWHEGRLQYNAIPRLWTVSNRHAANGWATNIASTIAHAISYGSISLLTMTVYVEGSVDMLGQLVSEDVPGPRYGIDFSAWGLLGLGIGLFLQATVSTFCLYNSSIIACWSLNVLSFVKACVHTPPKFVDSSQEKRINASGTLRTCAVQDPQPCMRQNVPQSKRLSFIVWILFAAVAIWTLVEGLVAYRSGSTTTEWVKSQVNRYDSFAFWTTYGQTFIIFGNQKARRDWAAVLIQSVALTPVMLSLHAAEVLINMYKDETVWRKASTYGAAVDETMMVEEMSNTQTRILFVFKFVVPWLFSMAMTSNMAVFMALLPLCALTLVCGLLAVFVEILVRKSPKGSQPATYGDVSRIIDLVDDWTPARLFWGDAGEVKEMPGVRRAGTSGKRMPDLDPNSLYLGL